jgi:predicted amidohydrolase
MDIELGKKERNLERIRSLVKESAAKSPIGQTHIVCLPELCTTAFDLENYTALAEIIPNGKTTSFFQNLAKKYGIHLVASIIEEEKGQYYNCALVINNKGQLVHKYRKIHLFPIVPMHESEYFTRGNSISSESIIDIDGTNVGVLICFDVRFPEISRRLVLDGAEVLIYLAEFPRPRDDIWRILLHARAIENQIFVAGVNRVGGYDNVSYFGNSIVIDPLGKILVCGSEKEEILSVSLDLNRLLEAKDFIPTLEHRHPEKYSF